MLVVDGHVDSSEMASLLLESRGHEARTASTPLRALRVAIELNPHVAVIDIRLGDEGGYALARQLRLLPGLQTIRLVAVTGFPSRDSETEAAAHGVHFNRCLTKPIAPSALFSAVEDDQSVS